MSSIKPIEGRSVHQIQSGQVIVDLNSVAKELVENALDAGATAIDVRFKNYGADSVEVQDNGSGVAPEDFGTIALKHYTSKLSTYDDLESITTFGFRGEALSSLCALSKFHITTARAVDGPKGTKIEFEQSGKVKGTSIVAAKQGTTVVVEDLFYNLPVRRKELEKSVKRQYTKVLELLQAYACISVGVKFSVSNHLPKGKKTAAFATQSNPNTKENIANVYSSKTLLALIPLNLTFEMDPSNRPNATQSARNWSTQEDPGARSVRIVGHISRPVVGEGRQTPDRQMFFVNSRPCHLPQVAKAFNEVYKSFNITQSPFILADIRLDTNAYDVNVSPDKREILLHDQGALLESVKEELRGLFEGEEQSVPLAKGLPAFKPPVTRQRETTVDVVEEAPQPQVEPFPSQSSAEEVPNARPGFVRASLIERFAGRDAQERVVRQPPKRSRSTVFEKRNSPALEEEKTVESATEDQPERDESPLFEPAGEPSQRTQRSSNSAKGFDTNVGSQHTDYLSRDESPGTPAPKQREEEEHVSSIKQTPQSRLSQSTIHNAFDRMRPTRTPLQQATITVGNTTTVSTIGGSARSLKKAQIHMPKFGLNGTPLFQTPKKSLFGKSLHGFAAPGTQMEGSGEEEDEDDDQDSSMPDAPARTPSATKHAVSSHVFESSATGVFSSSIPVLPVPVVEEEDEADASLQQQDDASDDEYIDESEKKAREEAKIAKMIAEAEKAAARPTETNLKRADRLFRISRKKHQTIGLVRDMDTSVEAISDHIHNLGYSLQVPDEIANPSDEDLLPTSTQLDQKNPEERLSLTVTKSDFETMRIIGQFNLGFILAVRPPTPVSPTPDLFIIDQHASDEKYNFEKFAATTVLVSQRLVHPLPLQLTAIEREVIANNQHALTANGFVVSMKDGNGEGVGNQHDEEVDDDGDDDDDAKQPSVTLTALPMSKEATFTLSDLEELLALLVDNSSSNSNTHSHSHPSSTSFSLSQHNHIPRPSKVRKLLASRACRSSVMIGKTLKQAKMESLVRHMGEMDKPWSCPHGRPTMRHLFGMGKWEGWQEGEGVVGVDGVGSGYEGQTTDWGAYLERQRG